MYYLSRLRDLRQDRDLKQKEIAALLKIDQRVYSTYETGKREIPLRHLVFLAQYYHTSTDYLLGLTNEENPYPAIKTNHRVGDSPKYSADQCTVAWPHKCRDSQQDTFAFG